MISDKLWRTFVTIIFVVGIALNLFNKEYIESYMGVILLVCLMILWRTEDMIQLLRLPNFPKETN
jgi:hypothetical protein